MSPAVAKPPVWNRADVEAFLPRPIVPVRAGFFYHLGLFAVTAALVIMQAIYVGMVALAGYFTVLYILNLPRILSGMSINFLSLILIATPVVTGAVATFFLLKPLFAKAPKPVEMIHLDAASEPVLFAFIQRLCQQLKSPAPRRIDIDLRVNASAHLRKGWKSLLSRDLVLTIGLPLAAGLDIRQFSGVIAHEFGHFSQHAGMRLYLLIELVRKWFARVAFERDQWDAKLDWYRSKSGWRTKLIASIAWGTVQMSRYVLRGMLYCANVVSAWFSRHMEFDADNHAAALVGGASFEQALLALPVLECGAQIATQVLNQSWKSQRLCDDYAALVNEQVARLDELARNQIVTHDLERKTERWSTHPATSERVQRVAGIAGVASDVNLPATVLFADFAVVARRATEHLYKLNLGEAYDPRKLARAERFLELSRLEVRRAAAVQEIFGPLTMPARWFRLPDGPLEASALSVHAPVEDESTRYWSVLEESILRSSALQFVRAGGKVNPGSFQLSSADPKEVEREESESRLALRREIARLRELFEVRGARLPNAPGEWRSAYRAYETVQDDFLELRYRVHALVILMGNLRLLPAARAANARDEQLESVRRKCEEIVGKLSGCVCPPLEPGDERRTLAEQLMLDGWDELSVEHRAQRVLDRADVVGSALLGELCGRKNEYRSQETEVRSQNADE